MPPKASVEASCTKFRRVSRRAGPFLFTASSPLGVRIGVRGGARSSRHARDNIRSSAYQTPPARRPSRLRLTNRLFRMPAVASSDGAAVDATGRTRNQAYALWPPVRRSSRDHKPNEPLPQLELRSHRCSASARQHRARSGRSGLSSVHVGAAMLEDKGVTVRSTGCP